jgi:FSR family fosmidomycin resistance protein-like MFS transporter
VLIIIVSQSVSLSALNFTPKLFTELGFSTTYVGIISGLFMFGSAVGGIVGGAMADRTGGKPVILLALLGGVAPLFLYIPAEGFNRFMWLFAAGLFVGMPHSILVLMAHTLLPGRRALASGLTLGFMFFSGAIGTYVSGLVADQVGLAQALQGIAFLPLLAVGVVPLLPAAKGA